MTIEEVKTKFGDPEDDGYVYCSECPCSKGGSDLCKHGGSCKGRDDAWQYILDHLGESNSVNHPSHYNQGGIECIDAMVAAYGKEAVKHFCMCNAFKYIWRADHKNGKEDIDKAIWYLNKFKELKSIE